MITQGAALLLATLSLAESPRNHLHRDIQVPARNQPTLTTVTLDPAIFLKAAGGLADLRVVDGDGVVESHLTRRLTKPQSQERWSESQGETITAGPLEGGGFRMVVRLRPGQGKPTRIRIVSPLHDFENRLLVEGMAADGSAQHLAEGVLADYHSMIDFKIDSIQFAPGNFREFRITVEKPTLLQAVMVTLWWGRADSHDAPFLRAHPVQRVVRAGGEPRLLPTPLLLPLQEACGLLRRGET